MSLFHRSGMPGGGVGVWGREGDIQKPVCSCKNRGLHGWLVVRSGGIFSGEEREWEGAEQHERGSGRKVASRLLLAPLQTLCLPTCTGPPTHLVGWGSPPHTASHESSPDSLFHPMSPPGPMRLGSGWPRSPLCSFTYPYFKIQS